MKKKLKTTVKNKTSGI